MKEIERVCKEWLDNADLYELTVYQNGNILLKFIVGGKEDEKYWIDVECGGVHVFNMAKSWEESFDEGIFVGGVRVYVHRPARPQHRSAKTTHSRHFF